MTTLSLGKHSTTRMVSKHPGLVKLGQLGWLAKGIVYVLAGVLAMFVSIRSFGTTIVKDAPVEASPTGALNEIAGLPGGKLVLIALAAGLLIYAIWRLLTALLPGDADTEALAVRVGYLVSAVLYATFSVTAIALVRHPNRRSDGDQKARDMTSRVLTHGAGRFLLAAVGLIVIGAGVYRCMKAARGDVTEELALSKMSPARARWTKRLAIAGEIGRGIAVSLIGFFLVRAAVTVNAQEATGLDDALRRVARVPIGRALVLTVAVGFLLYGVMCVETFRDRRFRTP